MALSEAPMVALALLRSFGDQAFQRATQRADEAGHDGKFATAYEWRRVAEIIRDETATELSPDDAAEPPHASSRLHHSLIGALVRWIQVHLLLTRRPGWDWDPFGPDLAPWKVMGLADDGHMIRTHKTPEGYEHLLDHVGLPSTACAECAGHLVCAEVRRVLVDRANRLRLETRAAHNPNDTHLRPTTHARTHDGTVPEDAASSSNELPVLGPCEAEIRAALIACWMRKSGLTRGQIHARPCHDAANPSPDTHDYKDAQT